MRDGYLNPRLVGYIADARRLRAAGNMYGLMLLRLMVKAAYGHDALVTLDNMLLKRGK